MPTSGTPRRSQASTQSAPSTSRRARPSGSSARTLTPRRGSTASPARWTGGAEMHTAPRDLTRPPRLSRKALRITPLGGVGEIGRNMTVFEQSGRLLVVDCGVLFPEDHQPGVDVILPDFAS